MACNHAGNKSFFFDYRSSVSQLPLIDPLLPRQSHPTCITPTSASHHVDKSSWKTRSIDSVALPRSDAIEPPLLLPSIPDISHPKDWGHRNAAPRRQPMMSETHDFPPFLTFPHVPVSATRCERPSHIPPATKVYPISHQQPRCKDKNTLLYA